MPEEPALSSDPSATTNGIPDWIWTAYQDHTPLYLLDKPNTPVHIVAIHSDKAYPITIRYCNPVAITRDFNGYLSRRVRPDALSITPPEEPKATTKYRLLYWNPRTATMERGPASTEKPRPLPPRGWLSDNTFRCALLTLPDGGDPTITPLPREPWA